MSVEMETYEPEALAEPDALSNALALAEIRDEVRAQRAEARRIYSAFAFLAAGALIIALANLVAVAVKLDGTSTNTVSVAAPVVTRRRRRPPPRRTPAPSGSPSSTSRPSLRRSQRAR